MSLCDRCFSPGACCKDIPLITPGLAKLDTVEEANDFISTIREAEWGDPTTAPEMPFKAKFKDENGVWRWSCPALQRDGRCGIYESRPHVCRKFEPASDAICVHYQGAESGDASAGEWPCQTRIAKW
jgi:Fe-S-cluster containining protein